MPVVMSMTVNTVGSERQAIHDGMQSEPHEGDHEGNVPHCPRPCGEQLAAEHGDERPHEGCEHGDGARIGEGLGKDVQQHQAGHAHEDERVEGSGSLVPTDEPSGEEGSEEEGQEAGDK